MPLWEQGRLLGSVWAWSWRHSTVPPWVLLTPAPHMLNQHSNGFFFWGLWCEVLSSRGLQCSMEISEAKSFLENKFGDSMRIFSWNLYSVSLWRHCICGLRTTSCLYRTFYVSLDGAENLLTLSRCWGGIHLRWWSRSYNHSDEDGAWLKHAWGVPYMLFHNL